MRLMNWWYEITLWKILYMKKEKTCITACKLAVRTWIDVTHIYTGNIELACSYFKRSTHKVWTSTTYNERTYTKYMCTKFAMNFSFNYIIWKEYVDATALKIKFMMCWFFGLNTIDQYDKLIIKYCLLLFNKLPCSRVKISRIISHFIQLFLRNIILNIYLIHTNKNRSS